MTRKSNGKSSAMDPVELELIGFGSGSAPLRSLSAKVGEKPKKEPQEPPEGFFDDDNGNGNGDNGNGNGDEVKVVVPPE